MKVLTWSWRQRNILKTITKNFGLVNLNNAGTGVSVLIPPL